MYYKSHTHSLIKIFNIKINLYYSSKQENNIFYYTIKFAIILAKVQDTTSIPVFCNISPIF